MRVIQQVKMPRIELQPRRGCVMLRWEEGES